METFLGSDCKETVLGLILWVSFCSWQWGGGLGERPMSICTQDPHTALWEVKVSLQGLLGALMRWMQNRTHIAQYVFSNMRPTEGQMPGNELCVITRVIHGTTGTGICHSKPQIAPVSNVNDLVSGLAASAPGG